MTHKEATDNLAFTLGKSDDGFYKRKLARDVIVAYAEVRKRDIRKKSVIPSQWVQNIPLIPMEKDVSGIFSSNKTSNNEVYKTVVRIPEPITTREREPGFLFVGGKGGQTAFHYLAPERYVRRTSDYQLLTPFTYIDGYIYVYDNIKNIRVRASFADLMELDALTYNDTKLWPGPIIIDDNVYDAVEKIVLSKVNELGVNYQAEVEVDADKP